MEISFSVIQPFITETSLVWRQVSSGHDH